MESYKRYLTNTQNLLYLLCANRSLYISKNKITTSKKKKKKKWNNRVNWKKRILMDLKSFNKFMRGKMQGNVVKVTCIEVMKKNSAKIN